MDAVATFVAALALMGVQVLPRRLRDLPEHVRRPLHSASGGVAVTFVFLHLFPELDQLRDAVSEQVGPSVPLAEPAVFVLALAGLVGFYGIEVISRRAHRRDEGTRSWADHVGITVFAGYYAVIGYLLWDQFERGAGNLVVYTLAMGFHFLAVDYGLRETHREAYVHAGRWFLVAAIVLGWAAGSLGQLTDWGLGVLLSLFAGALVLVALKEELPAERAGHYVAFVTGAVSYAALLATLTPRGGG